MEIKRALSKFNNEVSQRADAILNFTEPSALKTAVRGLNKTNKIAYVPAILSSVIYITAKNPYIEVAMLATTVTYVSSLVTEFALILHELKHTKKALSKYGMSLGDAKEKAENKALGAPRQFPKDVLSKIYLEEIVRDAKLSFAGKSTNVDTASGGN